MNWRSQLSLLGRPEGLVAGIDEAGRGPLAGPVVAAAVVLAAEPGIDGLADSKCVPAAERERLAVEIRARAVDWSVAWADTAEIDSLNILNATKLAMRRAILGLSRPVAFVQVDGNCLPDLRFPGFDLEGEAIVGGDGLVPAISAASILAKVERDRIMRAYDGIHPGYGFARHKGYCTREHLAALGRAGPCRQHRQSFRPVREARPRPAPPADPARQRTRRAARHSG